MRVDLYQDLYKQEDTHFWHIAKREMVKLLIKKFVLHTKYQKRILDVGCGTGKNIETFSEFGDVSGIDMSDEAILFAKKRGLQNVFKSSANHMPFNDSNYDIVTMLDVLEHIDETDLVEVNRILKNEGYLIVNVPAFGFLWSKWDEILHHKRRYTKKTLSDALNKFGFEVVFTTYHFSYLLIPALIFRYFKSKKPAEKYTSDFDNSNPAIQIIGTVLSKLERILVGFSVVIPFGTSVICIARKK
ncbi:MAG: class I SAM-dependent methyltransferase [Patescibacteria group bacterium]